MYYVRCVSNFQQFLLSEALRRSGAGIKLIVRSSHAGAAHARRPRVAGLADLAALLDADAVRGRARGGAGVASDGQHVLHAATHLQTVEGKGGAADDAADERGLVALVEVAAAEQEVVAAGRAEGRHAGGRRRRQAAHAAENDMLAVEVRQGVQRDEELRRVRVAPRVGHREEPPGRVLPRPASEALVGKLGPVNRLAAPSVAAPARGPKA